MMDELMLATPTPTPSIEANIGERRSSSRLQSLPKASYANSDRSLSQTPSSKPDATPTPGPAQSPQNESPISQRHLRKRKSLSSGSSTDAIADALRPLTAEERLSWKGWVELESDPVLFDYILRQYGVKNVKIQEVWCLDDETLSALPQPVFGLVFLFKYRDDDAEDDEDAPKCPKHVWFANQTTNNACATVSLMNIIMNVPEVDLGPTLSNFKNETQSLNPPYRGQSLSSNSFIRSIHNSFAQRMDILNADLALDNEFDKWKRARRAPKRKNAPKKKAKKQDDDDSGYHFIGYVPIAGEVWRLDGLQRQPVSLGHYNPPNTPWIDLARDNIMARISQYLDSGIEYSLLSLSQSPLSLIQHQLRTNMTLLLSLQSTLSTLIPDYRLFSPTPCISPEELQTSFDIPPIRNENGGNGNGNGNEDRMSVDMDVEKRIEEQAGDPGRLLELYRDVIGEQEQLRDRYFNEVEVVGTGDELARGKKGDAGGEGGAGVVYGVLERLAGEGALREIVRGVRG